MKAIAPRILQIVLGLSLSVCCLRAEAQYDAQIDVSRCYSTILQQTTVWQNDENTHYRLLSSMTKQDFESVKASNNLALFIPGLAADASWDTARARATLLVQQRDEELLKTTHTYSASAKLDPQATQIFRDCVRGKVENSAYGLFYYVTQNDPNTAQLQIEWKWIEGRKITIKSSTIDGGYIVDSRGAKRRSLFSQNWTDLLSKHDIREGQNFIIHFDDPNQDINIALESTPEVRYWPIVISHMPLRKKCETTWDTSAGNIPFHRSIQFDPSGSLTGKNKGGGSGFEHTVSVDGVVTEVTCDKMCASHIELDLAYGACTGPGYGAGTNAATCSGWLNANPRSVVMSYSWKKDHTDCDKEIPWELPKQPQKGSSK
jgi:hypothetical protein